MKSHFPSALFISTAGLGLALACGSEDAAQPTEGSSGAAGAGAQPNALATTAGNGGAAGMPTTATAGSGGATNMPSTTATAGSGGATNTLPMNPATDAGGSEAVAATAGTAGMSVAAGGEASETAEAGGAAGAPAAGGAAAMTAEPERPLGDISFSVPSGTYEDTMSVTIIAVSEDLEIRYTTDGSLPTASSPVYDGEPLDLSETTQLRAQLFDDGAATGQPNTAIYIRRTFDVTSDIPLIIMEAYGEGKPPTEGGPEKVIFRDLAFMLFEPVDGESSISALPTWASRAGYHVRGQSSASFEKTPYRVELWDETNEDADYPMIGMPADSDWAMVTPYTDKTLVRNAFAYSLAADMGLEAPELRFAEVYLNQDEGPLDAEDYQGVYAVTETIKNMTGRADLKQLRPDDTDEADLSGGYIFKFDAAALREDEGEIEIPCSGDGDCFSDLELTDPVAPNDEQLAWIASYIQELHESLVAEPIGDYQALLDLPSFVDLIILNELTKGGDKYVRSVYMHKDRDGLVKAGPVWDYNFTLNNFTSDVEGWQVDSGRSDTNWFKILFAQPEFRTAAAARWAELRQGIFSDAQLEARIDNVSAPLLTAGPRDLEKWPVGEGGGFFGGGSDDDAPTTWEGQIIDVKQWITTRTAWLDEQYADF